VARGRAGLADLRGSRLLNTPAAADAADLKATLIEKSHALGFDCIGVTAPDRNAQARQHFFEFVGSGAYGDMEWLAANPERRADPRALWPDVRSVIMLGVNYGPDQDPLALLQERARGTISVYARGDDYHDVIKKNLKVLAGRASTPIWFRASSARGCSWAQSSRRWSCRSTLRMPITAGPAAPASTSVQPRHFLRRTSSMRAAASPT
jgi:epoxyqueuosine reductase QueG-like protein